MSTRPVNSNSKVRFSGGTRWISVAVSETRTVANKLAGNAYRHLQDNHGRHPNAVRVITTTGLTRAGGQAAVRRAARDISERAQHDRNPADTCPRKCSRPSITVLRATSRSQ